jgi:predicted nucleic acid-binding protein
MFQHIQRPKIAATTSVTSSSDESDNRFLECAEAAQADYLVSGNTRHFPKKWKQTSIVTPRQLIQALKR